MNECDIEYPPCECDEPTVSSFPAGMEMRPMEPEDLDEVKRLHEQCFPVRYDMAFYENVVRGFIARGKGNAKEPLYTQVAVIPSNQEEVAPDRTRINSGSIGGGHRQEEYPGDYCSQGVRGGNDEEAVSDEESSVSITGPVGPPPGNANGYDWATSRVGGSPGDVGMGVGVRRQKRRDRIVGLITCQIMPLDRCRDQERLGLRPSYVGLGGVGGISAHTEVVYILTLGTETSYRRQGIGRALLRRCVWLSRQEESIGAVYLHVITTNPPAHRFYESEGFVQVCRISQYYRIDGELYDCFLYALFVNGAQPPGEWSWGIQSLSRRLRSIISFFRRTLGHVPEEGKLAAAVAAASGSGSSEQDSQYHHLQQQQQEQQERHQHDEVYHHRQQQQQQEPEEMEQDVEQPPCDSPAGHTVSSLAGAAGADAFSRGDGMAVADGDGAVATGAMAAASTSAGVKHSENFLACSTYATQRQHQQPSPQQPSLLAVRSGAGSGGTVGGTVSELLFNGNNNQHNNAMLNGKVLAGYRGEGASPPTVTLWDAAPPTGIGGGWGNIGGASKTGRTLREAVGVMEVGSGIVDVSSSNGHVDDRHWVGVVGSEPL